MGKFIDLAAEEGVKPIVFPELANVGYVFNTRKEIFKLSEPIPGGPTTEFLLKKAQEKDIYICAGISEQDGEVLYDSSVLVGPRGYIGKYRKNHLWDEEKFFFEPGNLGFPVFDLPFARVGMMICLDTWFPESPRILKLQKADIILNPVAWVEVKGFVTQEKPFYVDMTTMHAYLNMVFVIAADRIGAERGTNFVGLSNIAGPGGPIQRATGKEMLVISEINAVDSRLTGRTKLSDRIKDRRTDLYDILLGYREPIKSFPNK